MKLPPLAKIFPNTGHDLTNALGVFDTPEETPVKKLPQKKKPESKAA